MSKSACASSKRAIPRSIAALRQSFEGDLRFGSSTSSISTSLAKLASLCVVHSGTHQIASTMPLQAAMKRPLTPSGLH
jgi:hypothetical protein